MQCSTRSSPFVRLEWTSGQGAAGLHVARPTRLSTKPRRRTWRFPYQGCLVAVDVEGLTHAIRSPLGPPFTFAFCWSGPEPWPSRRRGAKRRGRGRAIHASVRSLKLSEWVLLIIVCMRKGYLGTPGGQSVSQSLRMDCRGAQP